MSQSASQSVQSEQSARFSQSSQSIQSAQKSQSARSTKIPDQIEVRGGAVNNLKNIDVNIPLHKFVAISGLSGSGKSSLAMGILYAEGSRRYLEALSTYTRRRISQTKATQALSVRHIPSALALRQRPGVPSERSTVGSLTEIFNVIRLVFSRLGSVVCPNGHRLPPTLDIAHVMDLPNTPGSGMGILTCPVCHVQFMAHSAEDFSFNAGGACPTCSGTGLVRTLDESKLIGDPNLTLDEGVVQSWHLPGRNFMPSVARYIGVRTDVPWKDLTDKEKDIVLNGKEGEYAVDFHTATGRVFHSDHTLYENAHNAVLNFGKTVKSERSIAQANKFYHFSTCPTCHGSRFNPELLQQQVAGMNIAQAGDLTLGELPAWEKIVFAWLPENMQELAHRLFADLEDDCRPLLELGLDYLQLSRAGNTLSTGELQRIQLSRTLRTETTGVLYVLDEPSVGLHPDNIRGLIDVFHQLISQGNSLVVVDHDVDIIRHADWVIEIGPGSGDAGGRVVATGTPAQIAENPDSKIGPYIARRAPLLQLADGTMMEAGQSSHADLANQAAATPQAKTKAKNAVSSDHVLPSALFSPKSASQKWTTISVSDHFNLHNVTARFPLKRLSVVTGFSGAGKTSLVLDSLVPALKAQHDKQALPAWVSRLDSPIRHVVSVDSTPVGKNTRSSVATYSGIMDKLRRLFAALPESQKNGFGIAHFSYNNKEGQCPTCQGLGRITMDLQFLPDMQQVCPTCNGNRYKPEIQQIRWNGRSIVDVLALSVRQALPVFADQPDIEHLLELLDEVGLGYLTLGEDTPTLSGGEAQRLKLAGHMDRRQSSTLFVFDEPTVGLHPLDVQTLIHVFRRLQQQGATVLVITHDLDMMANADWLVDLGPRGGAAGGHILASGKPLDLVRHLQALTATKTDASKAASKATSESASDEDSLLASSLTLRYLSEHLG